MDKIKKFLKKYKGPLIFSTILLICLIYLTTTLTAKHLDDIHAEWLSYWEFEEMVEGGKVELVEYCIDGPRLGVHDTEGNLYVTDNPRMDNFKKWLFDNQVNVLEVEQTEEIDVFSEIISIIEMILIFCFCIYLLKRMVPNVKNDKIVAKIPDISFDNIAGYNETKKNMEFLISFLKDNSKVKAMGARIPKGVVLYGPPGTGKTLMAKAIAGSAGVPFFSMSGSDFVEMYVGLGAARVRNLFQQARKKAPCIIFIDEIDAVGGKRGNGHDEKDQTINALLAELDGFSGSEGIVTICATNRIDQLDPALIRPGRFDRQIAIPLPDKDDRLKILELHAKNKKLSKDVDLVNLASMTVGFSGSSLESLLNEAAIIAITEGAPEISPEHIDQALFKILMKGEKKEHKKENRDDILLVAHHEAGHALAIKLLTGEEVPKVTIVGSTSGAGGVTFRTPTEKGFMSKVDIENYIKTLYAGRAAEEVYFKDKNKITGGASNDIEVATKIIRQYLTSYGMSDSLGLINVDMFRGEGPRIDDMSDKLLKEATQLSDKLYREVLELISNNEELLNTIAEKLIERESLTDSELEEIISINKTKEDSVV